MSDGVLAVAFDYSGAHRDEFHDWYDLEHLPERQAVPGFGACERWLDESGAPFAVATYDLRTLEVLRQAAYRAVAYENLSPWSKRVTGMCKRLLRLEGTACSAPSTAAPAGAGGLLVNAMDVDPAAEAEFNAWYDQEHIPALAAVPGTLAARRYVAGSGHEGTHRYLALYHLETPAVARSEVWRAAVETPWTARVRPHFRNRLRLLCRRYHRATDRGAASGPVVA